MIRIMLVTAALLSANLFAVPNAAAQKNFHSDNAPQTRTVQSRAGTPGSVSLSIPLAGGLEVEVTVAFESATNLTLANVGLSGALINPLDLLLLARIPLSLVSIPGAFPVMVTIEPPAGATPLEFTGLTTVTLDTENLPYYEGVRLRLFSAHGGGDFYDITDEVTKGSYRVRGSGGEFSEFIILLDDRVNSVVVDEKLDALSDFLTASVLAIDPTVYSSLSFDLAAVEAHWLLNERVDAVADLDAFVATIVGATPLEIPDLWTVPGGVSNVAGIMHALANTLRFSLLDSPCPAAGVYIDSDSDGVPDECDNCITVANPEQCDGDGDGFGNLCDGDLNNNDVTNFFDIGMFKNVFLSSDPAADLNCSGVVNFADLGILKGLYLSAPGPSGLVP